MFTTKNIIIGLAILSAILVIANWNKLFPKTGGDDVPYGDLPVPEQKINQAIAEVNAELSSERGINIQAKYDLLNSKLAKYGLWVAPQGTNPPAIWKVNRCCCKSSIFFGTIPVDCYFHQDCSSSSAQSACASSSA